VATMVIQKGVHGDSGMKVVAVDAF
jgi:hypothetical protein